VKKLWGHLLPATNIGGGEIRRVQRLGSSSLVVTLPKSWVKSFNIKPGDPVYVVVDGRSVRVMPVEGESGGGAALRVQGVSEEEAKRFLWCAYVLGPDDIVVEGAGEGVYEKLRDAAVNFVGVDVSREDNRVRVTILVDPARLDPRSSIRGIAGDLEEIVSALVRALRGEVGRDDVAKVRRSLQRSLALVERSLLINLSMQPSSPNSKSVVNMLVAANFLGLAASTFAEAAEIAVARGVESAEAASLLEPVKRVALEAALNVASPSYKRSKEILASITESRGRILSWALESGGREVSTVMAIAAEGLKHLQMATILSYCSARILAK
jgi:phosphate uptake regulator